MRAPRDRRGMTLIEVVVACTLLAITFTGLTGVAIKMGQRTRSNAIVEQRTAIFFQEVNRLESLPYDSPASLPYESLALAYASSASYDDASFAYAPSLLCS